MKTIRLEKKGKNGQVIYGTFKWSVSRGRDTYGYNICSIWHEGVKVASCDGGGYDMEGTCLADWFKRLDPEGIKKLNVKEYYGLSFHKQVGDKYVRHDKYERGDNISLDGACGVDSIIKIIKACGWSVERIS